jgi:hypothetical protein
MYKVVYIKEQSDTTVTIDKKLFEEIIQEAYDNGYKDGSKNYITPYPYYPYIYPYTYTDDKTDVKFVAGDTVSSDSTSNGDYTVTKENKCKIKIEYCD